jgi:hypothetical protein
MKGEVMTLRSFTRAKLVAACLPLAVLTSVAAMPVQSAAATSYPSGYCAVKYVMGCVKKTWQISTLTDTGPSYYVHKGGSLSISICKSYSNSASLGAQFTPIKDYLSINVGVTIESSYTVCTGASDPVSKAGYYHWYGTAKRWESDVYYCVPAGRAGCLPDDSYPVAQDRWYYRVVSG